MTTAISSRSKEEIEQELETTKAAWLVKQEELNKLKDEINKALGPEETFDNQLEELSRSRAIEHNLRNQIKDDIYYLQSLVNQIDNNQLDLLLSEASTVRTKVEYLNNLIVFSKHQEVKDLALVYDQSFNKDAEIASVEQKTQQIKEAQNELNKLKSELSILKTKGIDLQKVHDEAKNKTELLKIQFVEDSLEETKKELEEAQKAEVDALKALQENKEAIEQKTFLEFKENTKLTSAVDSAVEEINIVVLSIFTVYKVNQYENYYQALKSYNVEVKKNQNLLTELNEKEVKAIELSQFLENTQKQAEISQQPENSDNQQQINYILRLIQANNDKKTLIDTNIIESTSTIADLKEKQDTAGKSWSEVAADLSLVIKEEENKSLVDKVTELVLPLNSALIKLVARQNDYIQLNNKYLEKTHEANIHKAEMLSKSNQLMNVLDLQSGASNSDSSANKLNLARKYEAISGDIAVLNLKINELQKELNDEICALNLENCLNEELLIKEEHNAIDSSDDSPDTEKWWIAGCVVSLFLLAVLGVSFYMKKMISSDVTDESSNRKVFELA